MKVICNSCINYVQKTCVVDWKRKPTTKCKDYSDGED